ncbi:MAG TPA: carboxypeptidase-like regulatory domain-containing protein [Vicinamibacterales bacterium]|nr:carboxypeptidase-like regulatory domain-containing protein [Vicinamibacterales bacterium]
MSHRLGAWGKLVTFVASLASATIAHAQLVPPRDRAAARAEQGTGVIRGFVVDAITGEPLPRAVVQLIPMGASLQTAPVLTDGDGQFEFRDLPAARYLLRASRTPYLPITYGQRGQNTRGTPIELAASQRVEKIRIAISPAGVISGHVSDEFGFPAVGVEVRALQYRYENGQRQLSTVYSAGFGGGGSDDLGAFRIWGLQPGQYYVSAVPPAIQNFGPPTVVHTGPITTYFPNTADAAAAQRISVESGRETGGVNITLVNGRLATLRGRAVTSTGEPFTGASIMVTRQEVHDIRISGGGGVKPDGTFELSGIAAGQYLLMVRPMNARDDGTAEMARARVTVTGEDVDDILLVGSHGATLRGVITTDEGAMPPLKPSQMMVRVETAPEDRGPFGRRPPAVNDDYSFEIKGLFGRGRIESHFASMGLSPPGSADSFWAVKAVYWRGQNVTTRYIDFDSSPTIDDIEIVFSRRWAEVRGTVTDERGQPVADAAFVVFPADESGWMPEARRVRPMRTTPEGTFRMPGLHQGEYLVAITGPIEPGRWQDPEYLRSLVERATRVSVLEGEKKIVNLRISTAQ